MNPQSIIQLQRQLGLPPTGILDPGTVSAMDAAVTKAVSSNREVAKYAGANSAQDILNAYSTGNWAGVVSLSGKPFTDSQQRAAVSEAEKALAPAYRAQEEYDRAGVEDALRHTQESLADFQESDARQFGKDKDALDQNAVDQGILFSGARLQKQNDLRSAYQDRDADARRNASGLLASTARNYAYNYGSDAAGKLSSLYSVNGGNSYNPGVAHGQVTPSRSLSSAYRAARDNFQGTVPTAQKAQVQQRAAGLLANRANKLSLSGYGKKF